MALCQIILQPQNNKSNRRYHPISPFGHVVFTPWFGTCDAAPDWVSLSIFRNVKPVVPLLTVCQREFKVGGTTEWGGVWEGTKANWWRLIAE